MYAPCMGVEMCFSFGIDFMITSLSYDACKGPYTISKQKSHLKDRETSKDESTNINDKVLIEIEIERLLILIF